MTAATVNQVVVSGEVRKDFGKKQTKGGTSNHSFAIKFFNRGGYERQIIVQTYGQKADDLSVDEGDTVLVSGAIDEIRWQTEDNEWHGRHDLVADSVVNLSDLEGGGALDD